MTRLARPPLARGGADRVSTHPPAARTASSLTSVDALLTLQRSAGNRAVTHLLRQLPPVAVQRKLSYTPAQLDAERSVFGRVKGARTKDTLFQITETLRLYHRAVGGEAESVLLQALIGLSQRYKQRHPLSEKNNAKASAVDDLEEAAKVELIKLQAMQDYMRDLSTPMVPKPGSANKQHNPAFTHMEGISAGLPEQAKEMVAGRGQGSEEYRRTTKELHRRDRYFGGRSHRHPAICWQRLQVHEPGDGKQLDMDGEDEVGIVAAASGNRSENDEGRSQTPTG